MGGWQAGQFCRLIRVLVGGLAFLSAMFSSALAGEEARDDRAKTHIFYFHGRIVEDGLPAVHPFFGEYAFHDVTAALQTPRTVVHAKQRGPNADVAAEAAEASREIRALMASGVPAQQVAIVGASKGSQIAALVSDTIADPDTKLVILAGCWPSMVETMRRDGGRLYGAVLEIKDVADTGLGPGCGGLLEVSPGVVRHKSIVTELGVSHGLIYRPYDEWVSPTLDWATAP